MLRKMFDELLGWHFEANYSTPEAQWANPVIQGSQDKIMIGRGKMLLKGKVLETKIYSCFEDWIAFYGKDKRNNDT